MKVNSKDKDYYSKNMIKAVYGVAVIMMILHHLFDDTSLIKDTILPNSGFVEEKISFLAKMCVAIYSFLAGTGAARIKSDSLKELYRTSIKRVSNLYLKYWFIFVVCIPVGFIIGIYSFNWVEVLLNFMGLSSSYNGTWWFIYQYVVMMFFAPLIIMAINKWGGEKYFASVCMILVTAVGWICVHSIGVYLETVYFFVFIVGILTERFIIFERIGKICFSVINTKRIILSIICLGFVLILRLLIAHLTPLWFQMDILLAPIFVFFLKPILSIKIVNTVLSLFGNHSTAIWLSHAFICDYYFSRELFSVGNSILVMGIMLLVSLILGVLLDSLYNIVCRKRIK